MKGIKVILFIFVALGVFSGCENENQLRIPTMPVDLRLNLTNDYPIFKGSVNDTLVFTQPRFGHEYQDRIGFGGILVYTDISGNYCAFDLCCPNEVDAKIRIFPLENGKAVCRVCGSEYEILNGFGSVSKGPSKWALKRYQTYLQHTVGGDYLLIRN